MTKKILLIIISVLFIFSCKNNEIKNNNMIQLNNAFDFNNVNNENQNILPLNLNSNMNLKNDLLNNENILVPNNETLPLNISLNINDEINIIGRIILFNGWSPNIRMITENNMIIGIYENNISIELVDNMIKNETITKGIYKLKYLYETNIQYYENPLMVFEILEYNFYEMNNE